jgi:hypothetical protein
MVGTIASTAGITTFAIGGAKGIVAGYQTYASPHTCLTESERRLEKVRLRLQGLSPKRREEIEIASRRGSPSLKYLEDQLVECVLLIDFVSFSNPSSRRVSLVLRICIVE